MSDLRVISRKCLGGSWYVIARITFPTQPVPTELCGEFTHEDKNVAINGAIEKLKADSEFARLAQKFKVTI